MCFRPNSVCFLFFFFFFLEKCINATRFPPERDQSHSSCYATSQLCLPKEHFYNGCAVLFNVSSFKGNINKDIFGKSTVGLPAFMRPSLNKPLITSLVSFLLKESNGNNDYLEYQPHLCVHFSSRENDCAFARKLLLLFPFPKLRV